MEEYDGIREREDTAKKLPLGWFIFFIGVIVWGLWYMFVYVPIGSYSQSKEYDSVVAAGMAAAPKVAMDANPYIGKAHEIAEGKKLYAKNCSMCHGEGVDDDGGSMGVPLRGLSGYMSDAEQLQVVTKGRPDSGMPAFGGSLGTERIWEVLAYVNSVKE